MGVMEGSRTVFCQPTEVTAMPDRDSDTGRDAWTPDAEKPQRKRDITRDDPNDATSHDTDTDKDLTFDPPLASLSYPTTTDQLRSTYRTQTIQTTEAPGHIDVPISSRRLTAKHLAPHKPSATASTNSPPTPNPHSRPHTPSPGSHSRVLSDVGG